MNADQRRRSKAYLMQVQRGRCAYCHARMNYEQATLDHIVPRVMGGSNHRQNLCLACGPCNKRKGCKPPHLWLNELAQGLVA